MSLNVIDLIKGQLGPALVSQAASQYGESESGISKAIGGLLPAVVGGLANHADSSVVTDAISHPSTSGLLSNLMGGTASSSSISSVLSTIFGDKVAGIVNAISGYAGVNNSTSQSLLHLVTGATLGSLGKYASDNNLGTSGISSLLKDQKGIVSTLLPAGLSLATLGLGHFGTTPNATTQRVTTSSYDAPKVEVNRAGNTHVNVDKGEPKGSIWKWLLPLLLLLLAGYFLWKCNKDKKVEPTTVTTDTTKVVKDTAVTVAPATKVDEDIDLNGTKLKGYKGGMEDSMISFLKSDGYKNAADDAALKDKWYSFDHVNFKIGSSTELEASSEGQIQNLVAILKAFPDAKIKIGGYTDKTGNEADNKKLSAARAEFIKAELTKAGVGAQVLGAEGYGSEFATVAATASNEERAIDRKMAVRFAK